jgi:hypothetical protein
LCFRDAGGLVAVTFDLLHDDRHGLMEGTAEHLDEEVNGIAAFVGVEAAPVAALDDEAAEVGQFEVVACLRSACYATARRGADAAGCFPSPDGWSARVIRACS